jgi:3'-5' exoribonuclease
MTDPELMHAPAEREPAQPALAPELAVTDAAEASDRAVAPAEPAPPNGAKTFTRDLCDGQAVDAVFVIRDRDRRQKRNGEDFVKLRLGDVTGTVEAVAWDGVEPIWQVAQPGAAVRVGGRFDVDRRYGACITVRSLRAAGDEEYDARDLLDGPPLPYERMVADLRELVATMQDRHLRALLQRLLGEDSDVGRRWLEAPAAKYYHQAYRHGLLEHCLSVAQGVSAMAATFPEIDRDVAVAGALLHDIGKIEAYGELNGAIEMTDAGKLQGEIPLGYFLVRREIEATPGFPPETAQSLLHIILAHHGQLEHGSPVVPCTREATLVHMIDNLGGRLGSFDRLQKGLQDGERWSGFDRALSGPAYFASRTAA